MVLVLVGTTSRVVQVLEFKGTHKEILRTSIGNTHENNYLINDLNSIRLNSVQLKSNKFDLN